MKKLNLFLEVGLVLFLVGVLFFSNMSITGFVAFPISAVYVNSSITSNSDYVLASKDPLNPIKINSMSFSGKIIGPGKVKIFLSDGTNDYLIFSNRVDVGGKSITGFTKKELTGAVVGNGNISDEDIKVEIRKKDSIGEKTTIIDGALQKVGLEEKDNVFNEGSETVKKNQTVFETDTVDGGKADTTVGTSKGGVKASEKEVTETTVAVIKPAANFEEIYDESPSGVSIKPTFEKLVVSGGGENNDFYFFPKNEVPAAKEPPSSILPDKNNNTEDLPILPFNRPLAEKMYIFTNECKDTCEFKEPLQRDIYTIHFEVDDGTSIVLNELLYKLPENK